MKKTIFTFCLFVILSFCKSQCIENLGPDDFNQTTLTGVSYTDIVVNKQDVPFIVYSCNNSFSNELCIKKYAFNKWNVVSKLISTSDYFWFNQIEITNQDTVYISTINNQSLQVYKLVGNSLIPLGNPINQFISDEYCFKLDKANVPHLAITDKLNGNKLSVLKWNGSTWANVGIPGISTSTVACKSLAFDTLNKPIVAYKDLTGVYAKRFDGSNWNLLGTSIPVFGSSPSLQIKININKQNKLYFVFDHPLGVLMEFNGVSWNWIGGFFSYSNASDFNLDFNTSGEPTIGFSEGQGAGIYRAVVKTFNGTSWSAIGTPSNISIGNSNYTSMAMDKNLNPYLIYSDVANIGKAMVKKLNSNSWDLLGDIGFSNGAVSYGPFKQFPTASMATHKNGDTYIAYAEEESGIKTKVKKWNGSNWVVVGNAPINNTITIRNQIVLDTMGTPYLLYEDQLAVPSIVKYNGTTWTSLGNSNFAGGIYTSIAINPITNAPYVAYSDTNGSKASVVMFNGSNWTNVGPPAFSNEKIDLTSIVFDKIGTPYIAFKDKVNQGVIGIMKFNGSNWVYLNSPPYLFGIVDDLILKINSGGDLYLACRSGGTFVYKYVGTTWQTIGNNLQYGFSFYSGNLDMNIDKNGLPLLAFANTAANGGMSVLKYDGANWNFLINTEFSASSISNPLVTTDTIGNIYVAYASNRLFAKRIIPGPAVSITSTLDTLCVGQNVTLTASGSANFIWNIGSTNNIINVTPSVTTVYSVQAQTAGCISYASKNIVVNSCVGINEYQSNNLLTVYPNPTSGILFFRTSENNFYSSKVEIINSLGQSVLKHDYQTQIDISNLEDGIYTLILKSGNHQVGQKRIVISK